MAKNKKVVSSKETNLDKASAKEVEAVQNPDIEKSNEVLTVKKTKASKEDKKQAKVAKKNAEQKAKQKKAKNEKPKRHRIKETISELKKVSWPSFGKACKQTGAVLVVVLVFMLVILGVDSLISWIINLIVNI